MTDGRINDIPCPACLHSNDDHARESWYDEEGIEGMTCQECPDEGKHCEWWTHDWEEVVKDEAMHGGDDVRDPDD